MTEQEIKIVLEKHAEFLVLLRIRTPYCPDTGAQRISYLEEQP